MNFKLKVDDANYSINEEEGVITLNTQDLRFNAVKRMLVHTVNYGIHGARGACNRELTHAFSGEASFFPRLSVTADGEKSLEFDIIIVVPQSVIEMDEKDDVPLIGTTPFSKELGLTGLGFCESPHGRNSIYHARVSEALVVSVGPSVTSDVDEGRHDGTWRPYVRCLNVDMMAIVLRELLSNIVNSSDMVDFSYDDDGLPTVCVGAFRSDYEKGAAITYSCGAVECIKRDFLKQSPSTEPAESNLSKVLARMCGSKKRSTVVIREVSTWNELDTKQAEELMTFLDQVQPSTQDAFSRFQAKG